MAHELLIFTNKTYKNLLLTTVGFLFVINLMAFLRGYYLTLLPLLLHGMILIAYFKKWPEQRILIKIWSASLIVLAVAGLIGACSAALGNLLKESATLTRYISPMALVYQLVCLAIGLYYFSSLPKNTKVVLESEDLENRSTHAGEPIAPAKQDGGPRFKSIGVNRQADSWKPKNGSHEVRF